MRAENFLENLDLRGVAYLGGGAVGFHKIHFGRGIIHLGEGVLYGYFLALWVGGGDALAFAVRGGAHGVHQGVDLVAVPHGVGQALQDINRDGLGHHEAVGPFVEGIGAFRRQRAYLAELHEGGRRHHFIGPARYRHVEFACPQAHHRVVQRGQGGGAGRVHGHIGSVEIENIGYPAGRHVGQFARHSVFGYFQDPRVHARFVLFDERFALFLRQGGESRGFFKDILIIELVDAQIGHFFAHRAHGVAYYGRRHLGVKRFFIVAGVFQGHPHGFDGHLLQAGDLDSGLGRYLVTDRVELEAFYEAAYLGIGLVRGFMVFRIVESPVPAVGRNLGDAVAAFQHIFPEFFLIKGFRGYYSETYYRYFFIIHNLVASSFGFCLSSPG